MPLDNKISNIIGTKLPQWVLNQLETRANKNTQDSRDNDNILYLTNKSAWVRLVSSVDINNSDDLNYFKTQIGANVEISGILNSTSLAKEYVLYGGTSKYLNNNSYGLRSGINSDGSYGMLGTSEVQKFGYKPMPGITSVSIDTQGRLGSVRAATINFKCWDKNQLDIIEALYFKLGFTMFLEWGHTYFYYSGQNNQKRDPNKIVSTELYSIDPFEKGLNKEDIQIKIAKNSRETEGNYDAMLGIVTNFNFTYTQDGGYDCSVRLMALGVLGDSIKINNSGTLPSLLLEEILQLNNTLVEISNSVNKQNGAASGANTNENPQDLRSYPSCIQNLPGVKIADVSKSKSPRSSERVSNLAANAIFEGEDLYFYLDGQYQTTGFSKSGRWECLDGQLVLDGVTSVLAYLNKKINQKNSEPDFSELGKIVSSAGYAGSKTVSINDYDYLYEIENRGWSLLFPTFGAILPTDNTSGFVSSISIDNNYLFQKISNFLQYKPNTQNVPGPQGLPTLPGTSIPSVQSTIQSAQSAINTLEFSMFNAKSVTNDPELIRLDIDYFGANTKKYYASLRAEFSRTNPNFKKEILNRQAVYEAAISKFRSSQTFEFTSIVFEARPITETYGTTAKPFGTVSEKEINSTSRRYPVIKLSTTINVPIDGTVLKSQNQTEGTVTRATQGKIEIPVSIDLYITDTDLISSIKRGSSSPNYLKTQKDLSDQNKVETVETPTEEESPESKKEALLTQIKQSLNYQSTLEIMLRTIQLHALNKAINDKNKDLEIGRTTYVLKISDPNDKIGNKTFLEQIFSTGVFSTFIKELVKDPSNRLSDLVYDVDKKMDSKERFRIQSKYGFATSLLANKEKISDIPKVNFEELLKAYVVPYQINQEIVKGTYTNHPVYIPLGLVLMILNHSCTIYDTKSDDFQTPLVYIDFNPETNFCLTNAKHLSTDPWTCLIPFQGSFSDYRALFDADILTKDGTAIDHTSGSKEVVPLFNPEKQDFLSGTLPQIKFGTQSLQTSGELYRGKLMNILLNIDYLVQLAQQYSYKDGTNSVYLKTFIEQILADVNKSLGNFNAFRLSYNDSGNTFQIVDDQFVPSLSNEEQVTPKPEGIGIQNTTELPLAGKFSIAKNLEIKSEVSSRLSNMLAISANANYENKATLSTNGDSFGFINTSYSDRYITTRIEVTGSNNQKNSNDTLKISAAQFNNAISDFYSKINPSQTTVSHATNYYIEKMTLVKNSEFATRAAAMIPVSINFTTDGISGLSMGQAFTVPDILLPYTYTSRKIPGAPTDHLKNVGFVVVGLTHNIESNQWNTSVRANMIFLKHKTEFTGSVVKVDTRTGAFGINQNNQFSSYVNPVDISIPTGEARKNLVDAISKTSATTGIKMLALAQAGVEGYYPNTSAYRNNNPGNIRSAQGPFKQFSTLQEGAQAMVDYINRAVNKNNRNYANADTLSQYINVYAPVGDNNDPNSYIANILGYFKKVGVNGFNANSLMKEIATFNENVNLL